MSLEMKHREMIATVNNSSTEREHDLAWEALRAWRMGVGDANGWFEDGGWMNAMYWQDADLHHEGADSERPMCIGVFLDWRPSA
jgi:hypothetical protein